uniref:histidine kinase n=1 Tax=Hordeum vulgare subsp. vulgare TaxID=112509 RepID=F2DK92_HORVV|nr:predicted protein [Hordeum vulgare subsp. vulgare]
MGEVSVRDIPVNDGFSVPLLERRSLCLPSVQPGIATQFGEHGFVQNLTKHFPSSENNALERLVQLKHDLRAADSESFWSRLMEGVTDICHAQYGFVAKRVLTDDHNSAIEMPTIGDPGSCLLGVAFYYNDGDKQRAMLRDYKYLAWDAPCSYMKHDKVFLIPENMSNFITHNPNALPFPAEGYLGVPLFQDGKCFAHFGLMWTQEGLERRDTSWGFIEMLLHTLEDVIVDRLANGPGFSKPQSINMPRPAPVIPRQAVPGAQSLKPFAKNLSHELRTPMQGVVGMLDVMHATVQEQIEGHSNSAVRSVFQTLKDNIETVQDSSKRAVEAADNVVHAYDMNMQIPETPLNEHESPANANPTTSYFDFKPARLIEGSDIHVHSYKRRRSSPTPWHFGNATKARQIGSVSRCDVSPKSGRGSIPLSSTPRTTSDDRIPLIFTPNIDDTPSDITTATPSTKLSGDSDTFPTPGLRQCRIRELIPTVIHDALRVGGRPDSAIGQVLDLGERIIVRSRSSNGHTSQKTIEWTLTQDVPETLLVDERDLAKLVSAVFLNAIKFTENGNITLSGRLSKTRRFVIINVKDTGDGIPVDFQPELFKPFSREDDSLTRSKEGLGLGLLVAKGLARRVGGDITLVGSQTSGPDKGSEFEIRVPIEPSENPSRTGTPRSITPDPSRSVSRPVIGGRSSSPTSPTSATQHRSASSQTHITSNLVNNQPHPAEVRRVSSAPITPLRQESYDRNLAQKHPLTFLVAEDNKINRKLLVNMLGKLGYKDVHEAFDGKEAVRIMRELLARARRGSASGNRRRQNVDVILMDLWMPEMDGYQATEKILNMFQNHTLEDRSDVEGPGLSAPVVLAVSADVTDEAIDRATKTGMEGFMTKPYKLMDLQKLILEFCIKPDGIT